MMGQGFGSAVAEKEGCFVVFYAGVIFLVGCVVGAIITYFVMR